MRQLKWLSLLALLLLGPSGLLAQSVRFQSQAISSRGAGIANATVAVCTQPANTNTQPCSPLATLATSTSTTSGGANPLTADSFGNFFFYAAPGRYTVQIYGPAVSGQFVTPDVELASVAGGSVGAFTNLTISGTGTFTGPFTSSGTKSLNNILFASQFCSGSNDLGVCINNATASSANPQKLIIDSLSPSTLSTSPNIPIGWTVECTGGTYTLAASFTIQHRGVQFFGGGCQFNYNQDTGTYAFIVGKNLHGTANCNGTTTITQASGSLFTQFDQGDKIVVGATGFNIASVTDSTHLVATSTCSTVTGATFDGLLTTAQGIGSYLTSIHLRDFNIVYNGAGTNANDGGVECILMDKFYAENISAISFNNGFGFNFLGCQGGEHRSLKADGAAKAFHMGSQSAGTTTVLSSINALTNYRVIAQQTAAGYAVLVDGDSFGNSFAFGDIEGAAATKAVQIAGTAHSTWITNTDFEKNGDGTASSRDIYVTAVPSSGQSGQYITGNTFSSAATNTPNTGIECTGSGVPCYLDRNTWFSGALYTFAYQFTSSANGTVLNTNNNGFSHIDPGGQNTNATPVPGNLGVGATGWNCIGAVNSVIGTEPWNICGNSDATGQVAMKLTSRVSGQGDFIHFTDSNTFDMDIGADGATGDLVFYDGRSPGGAGTERFRIKRSTGFISTAGGIVAQASQTIASGTSTMTSGAVTAATCQTAVTTSATNTATTDSIEWAYATAPTLTTDALLHISPYVTSGNVNFIRCNPTASSITGTAIVINWRVIR